MVSNFGDFISTVGVKRFGSNEIPPPRNPPTSDFRRVRLLRQDVSVGRTYTCNMLNGW